MVEFYTVITLCFWRKPDEVGKCSHSNNESNKTGYTVAYRPSVICLPHPPPILMPLPHSTAATLDPCSPRALHFLFPLPEMLPSDTSQLLLPFPHTLVESPLPPDHPLAVPYENSGHASPHSLPPHTSCPLPCLIVLYCIYCCLAPGTFSRLFIVCFPTSNASRVRTRNLSDLLIGASPANGW